MLVCGFWPNSVPTLLIFTRRGYHCSDRLNTLVCGLWSNFAHTLLVFAEWYHQLFAAVFWLSDLAFSTNGQNLMVSPIYSKSLTTTSRATSNVVTVNDCYQTYVRPQLEYAFTVWSSYTKANVAKLEMVQQNAAFQDFSWYSSPTAMTKELEWMTLEQRRLTARLVMMYQIQYRLINVTSDCTTKSHSLRGHPTTLQQIRTRCWHVTISCQPDGRPLQPVRPWKSGRVHLAEGSNVVVLELPCSTEFGWDSRKFASGVRKYGKFSHFLTHLVV